MVPLIPVRRKKIPIAGRCCLGLLSLVGGPRSAAAQSRVVLDAETVAARVVARSPAVRIAEARISRAQAQTVGADAFSRENPTLSVWGGPRQVSSGDWLADLVVTVSMPFDLGGVRRARTSAAEAAVRLAEAEADEARQSARVEAMALWLQCLIAEARLALQRQRVATEEAAHRAAEVRHHNGAVGMGDLVITTIELALARGAERSAEAARDTALMALRGRLSLAADVEITLSGGLAESSEPATLDVLLAQVHRRAELRRATLAATWSTREAELQSRLGIPPLRVGLSGGRENEYYGRVGVDFALPLIQRNQTAVAVARAGVRVAEVERESLRAQAEADLRTAFTAWSGARRALVVLEAALPAADQSDRLAIRAYELGQRDVESTLVVFRQTHELRAARLDAAIAVAEARRAIERATGGP